MEGYSRHFPGPCHYSVSWKTPRSHHWARARNSNFFQAHYSVCQEHKPLIYEQHDGEVTPYLANPTACLKEEGGQNSVLGTGMRSGCTGPSSAHTSWCRVLQSHSFPPNLPEDRVHVHCQHPSHVPSQPCCLFLAPLFSKPLGCPSLALSLLFSFHSVPAWTSHPRGKHTPWHSNQWTTGQTTHEEQSLPLHDSSPLSYQVPSPCQHWREASHENTPHQRGTRASAAGAAQYLHFVVECPSYISGVVNGCIHRAAAENQHIFESTL